MKIAAFTLVIAIILGHGIITGEADKVPLRYAQKYQYMVLANEVSAKYGVTADRIKTVIKKESSWVATVVGDHGKAYGLAQYHRDEFDRYAGLYEKATGIVLDYHSPEDQVTLMAWQFANYPKSRRDWSTYRRIYMKK